MKRSTVALLMMASGGIAGAAPAAAQLMTGNYDYPAKSLKEREEGIVVFRAEITEKGRATHCTIEKSSGYPRLDKATCDKIVRLARFKPGTDGDGKPTRSVYQGRMNWVIPDPLMELPDGNVFMSPPATDQPGGDSSAD